MKSKSRDRDQYVVAALFALGVLATGATYMSSDVIATRFVRAATVDTGLRWSTIVADATATAGKLDGEVLSWRLSSELRDASGFAPISSVSVYDAAGNEIAATNPDTGFGMRAGLALDTTDSASLREALAGRLNVLERESHGSAGQRRFADIYAPVALGAAGTGVVKVTIDKTEPVAVFSSAFEMVTSLTAFTLWIAFIIPTFIAWRRIEDRRQAQNRIEYLAHHDALTDLPNRVQFNAKLAEALARGERHGKKVAVLCLDLDRFKDVNDTLGHPIGDALLKRTADRLRTSISKIDTIGRLGGDEFAVVAEGIEAIEDAIPLAERLCDIMAEAIQVNGHDIASSTSIGIAIAPDDGLTADDLLKNADLALYRAKTDGRNTFRFFEEEMDIALQRRRLLEHDMRQALRLGQFDLHYQPQYDLNTNELVGYEALLRWQHPEEGTMQPHQFIPVAEESGLIVQIGHWVLNRACTDAAGWPSYVKMAVNLSPAQFRNHEIVETVRAALAASGLAPGRLELEITEGMLLQNTETTLSILNELRAIGVSIAMDDFGTGYSSLSYLSRFPFDKIKIDRSFIDNLHRDSNATALVNTIIGLGRSLNMTITAEGVETSEQASFLRSCGCNEVQGYLYGMPDAEGGSAGMATLEHPSEVFAAAEARADELPGHFAERLLDEAGGTALDGLQDEPAGATAPVHIASELDFGETADEPAPAAGTVQPLTVSIEPPAPGEDIDGEPLPEEFEPEKWSTRLREMAHKARTDAAGAEFDLGPASEEETSEIGADGSKLVRVA